MTTTLRREAQRCSLALSLSLTVICLFLSLSLSLPHLLDMVRDIHLFLAAAFTNVNIPQGIE